MANLQSKAFANILDLVSEGQIEGLVDGAKSIYLNGTPLQNPDNSYNFNDVICETRNGSNDQTYIAGTPGVESETIINVEVKQATSVTRTITSSMTNAIRVTLSVSSLFQSRDDGSTGGTSVQVAIDVQTNGGGFVQQVLNTIDGKATSKFQRSYRIALLGTGPWDVRVRRITEDSTDLKLQNKTYWDAYTEIVYAKLRYPNSALVSMRFNAASFSGVPSRAYDLKLKKIQIPANYNPETRAYTGSWDGTFQTAWSDNPAWCFYDLVTNTRYGLGNFVAAGQVDKWALYSIAQYCDELVDDGFGGTEPRFTCNMYLQSQAEAYKVVQDMASCFRSMIYWSTGTITLSQDAPADAVALYSQANVEDGAFNYSGSSAKARHTVALVTWNDPADLYTQKVEYVEDPAAIARFGIVQTSVVAIGCTSRGQANRVGRWLLYAERYESEVVSFTTGVEGAVARPGQIIKVADASRAGIRLGGRISSATTTSLTLDAPVALGAASWTAYAMLTDGTVGTSSVSGGTGNTITLTTALPSAPQAGAQWILSKSTVEAQTFRVLTASEREDGKVEITGLSHNPSKYAYVDNGLKLQVRDITDLNALPDAPGALTISEALYTYQAEVRAMVNVGWENVQGAASYRVQWRKDSGNFIDAVATASEFDILNITPGVFTVRVYSVGANGRSSDLYSTATITALGKTAPPSNVTGFAAVVDPNIGVTLKWTANSELDLDVYEIRSGASFAAGTLVGKVKGNTLKIDVILPGSTTYWIAALDTSGFYSATPASAATTITAPPAPSVSAAFSGQNIVLSWAAVQGSLATAQYEIRYGTSFAAGTSLGTVNATVLTTKAQWLGSRTFWVAATDIVGNRGAAGDNTASITAPGAMTMSQEVVDNNVLLRWSDATGTLPIDYYELRRGSTWATATLIGKVSARFSAIFESAGGLLTYWVGSYDLAGNAGPQASVAALVNQPPDYQLQLNSNSTFSGTKTNFVADSTGYLTPVSSTETWQGHFTSRGWTTPQDQINAGYPIYVLPSQTSGSYEETIDYGTVLAATKIGATLSYSAISGTPVATPTISVRKLITDPWTDYAGVSAAFVTDFRYAKIKYDFASSGGDDLALVSGLNIRYDVKLRNDAGVATISSSTVGGTVVNFNVAFVDVQSITVTPKGTTAAIAVYDFVDVANPTSFKILLFDTAGTRIAGDVSWSVKGI